MHMYYYGRLEISKEFLRLSEHTSQQGRFPEKFPEIVFFASRQISKRISGNLHLAQGMGEMAAGAAQRLVGG